MNEKINPFPKSKRSWQIGTLSRPQHSGKLRYALASVPEINASGCLVFVNGRSEWIEKYCEIPEFLGIPDSWMFLTFDHRGQGASSGTKAHIDSYETFARDLAYIIESVSGTNNIHLVAHSMGGLICLTAINMKIISPESLILSSPLLCLPNQPVSRIFSRPLSILTTALGFGKIHAGKGEQDIGQFAGNQLTSSKTGYQKVISTPHPIPGPTLGWIKATFQATDEVFKEEHLQSYTTPTLLIAGSEESVVEKKAFSKWVQSLEREQKPIEYHLIPGAKHEIFNERTSVQKIARSIIRSWHHWE